MRTIEGVQKICKIRDQYAKSNFCLHVSNDLQKLVQIIPLTITPKIKKT